ncbi:MAG: ribosome-associated translation inhibitor RaiA [Alphaproteobacteria bacterium]|nr:MAG: ribosome-associated translation inhibitor RaiA [Alphaproteobacteria bacterium]
MHISIAGVHMDTSEALRQHTEQKLEGLKTYFDQVLDVNVKFVQEPHHNHMHVADVTVHASGLMLRAEGNGGDWYGALDEAVSKITKQLKKYKGKLEGRKVKQQEFKEKIRDMGPLAFEENFMMDSVREADGIEDTFSEFAPDISKKEVSKISPMSVDEAVLQMDLLHKPAFLFMNVETRELNMVYREGENAIRWVAPKAA